MENSTNLINQNSSRSQFHGPSDLSPSFSRNLRKIMAKNQPKPSFLSQIEPVKSKRTIRNKEYNLEQRRKCQMHTKKKSPDSPEHPQNKQHLKKNQTQQNLIFRIPFLWEERNFKTKLKNYKVARLVRQFVDKLRRTSIYRSPLVYQPLGNSFNQNQQSVGIVLNATALNVFLILSILATLANCFLSTFIIAFGTNLDEQAISIFSLIYIIWMAFELVLGFLTFKKTLKDHFKSQFLIDFLCFISIITRLVSETSVLHFFQIFVFVKLWDALSKLKVVEDKLIQLPNQERYWGLTKMFIANFFLMHVIAIFLLLMSSYDPDNNWILVKKIQDVGWMEQYCWAFYWSATTMLTIGFGDIAPANYKEALTLVLIEAFSCMALAFNVNFIGKVLSQLQMKKIQEEKDKKILKKLIDRNEIKEDLSSKLSNFIEESIKLQTKYNFDQEKEFMTKLPKNLQNNILKESNTVILQKIHFFKNFANKTIYSIAQKLNQKVVHPAEHVCQPHTENIMILKEGQIGLFPNFQTTKFSHIAIDRFVAQNRKSAVLISMSFAKRQFIRQNYKLKSVGYSIVQSLTKSEFLDILQQRVADMQFFQSFQDKEHNDYDEDFELIVCDQCNKKHSKFICPRLHYRPISQKVIFKYLNDLKESKANRSQIFFRNRLITSPLIEFRNSHSHGSTSYTYNQPEQKEFSFNCNRTKLSIYLKSDDKIVNNKTNDVETNLQFKGASSKGTFKNVEIKKMIEVENCLAQVDKAANFEYYLREANPKELAKIEFRRAMMKKFNSFIRMNLMKKRKVLRQFAFYP